MDENTLWLIVGGVIGAILGAVIGGVFTFYSTDLNNMKLIQIQNKNEIKALANEYLNDLDFIENAQKDFEHFIQDPNSDFNNPQSPRYHSTIAWQDPIYPTWGMYHSNRQEIGKFDPNLAKKMITFYGLVLNAEAQRLQYNDYDKLYPRDLNDQYLEENRKSNLLRIFTNMERNINQSRPMISEIRRELEIVANS